MLMQSRYQQVVWFEGQRLEAHTGWQLVMIAIMANLVLNGGCCCIGEIKCYLKKNSPLFLNSIYGWFRGFLAGWAV